MLKNSIDKDIYFTVDNARVIAYAFDMYGFDEIVYVLEDNSLYVIFKSDIVSDNKCSDSIKYLSEKIPKYKWEYVTNHNYSKVNIKHYFTVVSYYGWKDGVCKND